MEAVSNLLDTVIVVVVAAAPDVVTIFGSFALLNLLQDQFGLFEGSLSLLSC
jgi:hypothetical protein